MLVHPGVIDRAAPPPPQASDAEHIRCALLAPAQRGRGKLVIEAGRPASTLAWAFVIDDQLVLSPQSRDDEWNGAARRGGCGRRRGPTDRSAAQRARTRPASATVHFLHAPATDRPTAALKTHARRGRDPRRPECRVMSAQRHFARRVQRHRAVRDRAQRCRAVSVFGAFMLLFTVQARRRGHRSTITSTPANVKRSLTSARQPRRSLPHRGRRARQAHPWAYAAVAPVSPKAPASPRHDGGVHAPRRSHLAGDDDAAARGHRDRQAQGRTAYTDASQAVISQTPPLTRVPTMNARALTRRLLVTGPHGMAAPSGARHATPHEWRAPRPNGDTVGGAQIGR